MFLHRASIDNNFISEKGIVAVLGDENQIVRSDMWKINRPLLSRGDICAKSGGAPLTVGRRHLQGVSLSNTDPFSEAIPPTDKLVDQPIL